MKKLLLFSVVVLACQGPAAAEGLGGLVSGGKASLQLRYRLENVDQADLGCSCTSVRAM